MTCNCKVLKNERINSVKEFERLTQLFKSEHNTYRCVRCYVDAKAYKCLTCGKVWLFRFPDFPEKGELSLIKTNIVLNNKMKSLLFRYNLRKWNKIVKDSRRISVGDNYIKQDESITYVIVRYVGREYYDNWIETPIDSLNGYTPIELASSKMGRLILKSYLIECI